MRFVKTLNEYGIKCTFNLNFGLFAPDKNGWRITEEEAKTLYTGHETAVHGYKHLRADAITEEEMREEITLDISAHKSIFGTLPVSFAYAYGAYTPQTIAALKANGIKYARTVNSTGKFDFPQDYLAITPTCHSNDKKLFEYLDEFLSLPKETPALFYLWGHSYEFDEQNTWSVLEEFCEKVRSKNDIALCTNAQAFAPLRQK